MFKSTPFSLFFMIFLVCALQSQESLNIDFLASVDRGDQRYSGCWAYTDADDGREYAFLGAYDGMAIYDITDISSIREVAYIEGPSTRWREITAIGEYAYVTTDVLGEDHRLQVIDLTQMPDTATLLTTYNLTFQMGHIIQRDVYSEAPYVYVMGTNTLEGVHIIDVSDPANPKEVGVYNPGYYIHDSHVKGDLLFACAFYEATVDIIDISDKTNPTLINKIFVPNVAVHSAWLTEDDQYLVVCSENDGLPARIYDVSDLNDITEVSTYTANTESLVHNPYVLGDFVYFSHNTEGLRIVDVADPTVPVEVAYYDTWTGPSGGFNGLWSANPYYGTSDKVIGGDRSNGLYVWSFDREANRAGRFYGVVKDAMNGEIIRNAELTLSPLIKTYTSDINGEFKDGGLPGDYSLLALAEGYKPKNVTFSLAPGDQLQVEILMDPDIPINTNDLTNKQVAVQAQPNPFSDGSQLDLSDFPDATQARVYDIQGQLIQNIPLKGDTFLWLGDDWAKGSYWVQITNRVGKTLAHSRLVKID
ncbi:MAG: choice-of-anchor B family protein [Bacteroidota bacterium]